VNTNTQILRNYLTTARTHLSRSFGIDFDKYSTGPFCLVRKHAKEVRPCRIVDVSIKNLVITLNHLARFQIFNKDKTETVYYLPAKFMQKVFTLIANLSVQSGKFFSGVARMLYRVFALKLFELVFTVFKVLRIFNNISVGHRDKRFNPDINADCVCTKPERLRDDIITGKSSIKMSVLAFDCNSFDIAFQLSMQLNAYISDILDIEFAISEFNAVTVRREGDRIKTVLAFKSWKPRLVSGLYASKESPKRFVQSPEDILRHRIIKMSKTDIKGANFFKCVGLIVVVDKLVPLLPTDNAMFQSAVVEKSGRVKKIFKFNFLNPIGEQSILESLSHFLTFHSADLHFGQI